jgi:O-antigen ligase
MAFALPFSTALASAFSILAVMFGLAGFDRTAFMRGIRHPISILSVCLFLWLALSALWSIAPQAELIEGVSKYRKLLYVPLLVMVLASCDRPVGFLMNFLVAGCIFVSLGSLGSSSGLYEHLLGPQLPDGGWGIFGTPEKHAFFIGPPDMPTFGRSYIAQGAMLVLAALYGLAMFIRNANSRGYRSIGIRSWLLVVLFFLFSLVVFNLGGRSGYVLLAVGMAGWLLAALLILRCKKTIGVLSGLVVVLLIVAGTHPRVTDRVQIVVNDVTQYSEGAVKAADGSNYSQGLRLMFWRAGIENTLRKPVLGWGVGSYAEVFYRDTSQPQVFRESRAQPHSEIVILFTQGGLIGLGLFLLLLLVGVLPLFRRLSTVETTHVLSSAVLLLSFSADAVFNSVIWDFGEGHLFVVLASYRIWAQLRGKDSV